MDRATRRMGKEMKTYALTINSGIVPFFQTALLSHHRPPDDEASYLQMIALSVTSLIVILVGLIFLLRIIGNIALG